MSHFTAFRKALEEAAQQKEVEDIMFEMSEAASESKWEHYILREVYERLPGDFKRAFHVTSADRAGVTVSWSPSAGKLNPSTEQSQ